MRRVLLKMNDNLNNSVSDGAESKKNRAILFLAAVILFFFLLPALKINVTAENIKLFIIGQGAAAPFLYVAVLIFLPLFGVPRIILASAGGALFGIFAGGFYAVCGSSLAAVLAYYLASLSTSGYVCELVKKRENIISALDFSNKNKFWLIIFARICPAVNCELVNYTCGALKIPFGLFISATIIGTIPGSIVYVLLGDSFMRVSIKTGTWTAFMNIIAGGNLDLIFQDKDMTLFFIAVLTLALFFLFTMAGFYILLKKKKNDAQVNFNS